MAIREVTVESMWIGAVLIPAKIMPLVDKSKININVYVVRVGLVRYATSKWLVAKMRQPEKVTIV